MEHFTEDKSDKKDDKIYVTQGNTVNVDSIFYWDKKGEV